MTKRHIISRLGIVIGLCGSLSCALKGPNGFEHDSSEIFARHAAASLQDPAVARQASMLFGGDGSEGAGGSPSRAVSASQPDSDGWKQRIRGWLFNLLARLPEGNFDTARERTTHAFTAIDSAALAQLGPVGEHLQALQGRLAALGVVAIQRLPDKQGVELRIEDAEERLFFLARSSQGEVRGQWRQEFGAGAPAALWRKLDTIAAELAAGPASMKVYVAGLEATLQEWRAAMHQAQAAKKPLWIRWSVPLATGIELSMRDVTGQELYSWMVGQRKLKQAQQLALAHAAKDQEVAKSQKQAEQLRHMRRDLQVAKEGLFLANGELQHLTQSNLGGLNRLSNHSTDTSQRFSEITVISGGQRLRFQNAAAPDGNQANGGGHQSGQASEHLSGSGQQIQLARQLVLQNGVGQQRKRSRSLPL
ncbi:MAG: hypothetical protein AAF471_06195, partial [Myxococcota bacterium]